jgi:hypothetical protein
MPDELESAELQCFRQVAENRLLGQVIAAN